MSKSLKKKKKEELETQLYDTSERRLLDAIIANDIKTKERGGKPLNESFDRSKHIKQMKEAGASEEYIKMFYPD